MLLLREREIRHGRHQVFVVLYSLFFFFFISLFSLLDPVARHLEKEE